MNQDIGHMNSDVDMKNGIPMTIPHFSNINVPTGYKRAKPAMLLIFVVFNVLFPNSTSSAETKTTSCGVLRLLDHSSANVQISENICQNEYNLAMGTKIKIAAHATLLLESVKNPNFELHCINHGENEIGLSVKSQFPPWIETDEPIKCLKITVDRLICGKSAEERSFFCLVINHSSDQIPFDPVGGPTAEEIAEILFSKSDPDHRTTSVRLRSIGFTISPSFPWPPPRSSAVLVVPRDLLINADTAPTLSQVDNTLSAALGSNGYHEKSYFSVPDGFAMVTKLEQINPDGTSKDPPARWSVDVPALKSFSLSNYLKALFSAETGFFRVLVFVVTSSPFGQNEQTVTRSNAIKWISSGLNVLPEEIGKKAFTENHNVTVLIYEFKKIRAANNAELQNPSQLDGWTHLEKSNILPKLTRQKNAHER